MFCENLYSVLWADVWHNVVINSNSCMAIRMQTAWRSNQPNWAPIRRIAIFCQRRQGDCACAMIARLSGADGARHPALTKLTRRRHPPQRKRLWNSLRASAVQSLICIHFCASLLQRSWQQIRNGCLLYLDGEDWTRRTS